MTSTPHPVQTTIVPLGLLVATFDHINRVLPPVADMDEVVITYALDRGYQRPVAIALALRVDATARLLRHPVWSSVCGIDRMLSNADRLRLERVVQRFIATAPIDDHVAFDAAALQARLNAFLCALPRNPASNR